MATIKRFGVLKTSFFFAIYSFFIGIIFSLIMALGTLLFSSLLSGLGALGSSWFYIILLPFIYAIITFIVSLISIPLMNIALKITKGIDLDLEFAEQTSNQPEQTEQSAEQ